MPSAVQVRQVVALRRVDEDTLPFGHVLGCPIDYPGRLGRYPVLRRIARPRDSREAFPVPFARRTQARRSPTGRRPRRPPSGRCNRARAMPPRLRPPRGRPGRRTVAPGRQETGAGPTPPPLPAGRPASERPTRAPRAPTSRPVGAPSRPRTRRSPAERATTTAVGARSPARYRLHGPERCVGQRGGCGGE